MRRRGLSASALGWRAHCGGRSGGKTFQGDWFSITSDLRGCCRGGGRWTCPYCGGCTTSCTVEDSLFQNVLSLPVAVEWWNVCNIQAMKPQPGLGIALGTNPQMMGELLWYVRFAGKVGSVSKRQRTILRLAHNGAPVSPVI